MTKSDRSSCHEKRFSMFASPPLPGDPQLGESEVAVRNGSAAASTGMAREIEVVDDDLGRSAARGGHAGRIRTHGGRSLPGDSGGCRRPRGFSLRPQQPRVADLVEVCRVVDTVLIDQEMVYAPRLSTTGSCST